MAFAGLSKKILATQLVAVMGLLAALLAGGCAPSERVPLPAPPPPGEAKIDKTLPPSALEQIGNERLAKGRFLLAVDAYVAALSQNPGPLAASRMRLNLARAYDGAEQPAMALDQLRGMPAQGGDSDALTKGLVLQAQLERKLGQLNQSAATLRRVLAMPPRPLSDEERRQALDTLVATQTSLGQYGQATGTLLDLAGLEGLITPSLRMRLAKITARASSNELESQLGRPRPPQLNALLLLAIARAQYREGRMDAALNTLGRVDGLVADSAIAQEVKVLRVDINQAKQVDPVAIGVMLPLSGAWAQPANEVLAAVELGLGVYESVGGKAPVLFIADTKGQPLEAGGAVDRLVDEHKVMAIIGPLGASPSLAAARQAQSRQVPLISLARIDGVTQSGPYVFQDSLTPQRQVDGLLTEAMSLRGKKRIAILAPDNSYGRGFADLMEKGVVVRGGAIVRKVFYDPKANDFTQYVQTLVKLPPGKYRPGAPDSPQPVIDFQALFIPDGPQGVAMATSQLRYFDVTGVLLMGTNLWHEARLLDLAARDVQGAIMPGCFDPTSSDPLVGKFVADYQKALGRVPTLLEAQGYDAARVLRHLVGGSQPPRTRQAMQQALAGIRDLPGVCGPITIGPQRGFEQPVVIFTVDRARFRAVRPSDRVEAEPSPAAPALEAGGQTAPPLVR